MDVRKIEDVLKTHPFFEGMSEDHLTFLAGCGSNARFSARDALFRQKEEANHFYIIQEGRIAVDLEQGGKEPLTIQTLGPGEVLGWSWLFEPYIWKFDARALEPVHAIAMDGKCLREKCENDHELGYEVLKRFSRIVVDRLQATRLQLLDVYGS